MAKKTVEHEAASEVTENADVAFKEDAKENLDISDVDSKDATEETQNSSVDFIHQTDLKMAKDVAFHSRTFKAATKAQKEEMYSDEHIIADSFDNQLNVLTPSMQMQEDKEELSSAASSKAILEGTVVGVQHVNPENEKSTPCACITYGHDTYKILIPYYCLLDVPVVTDIGGDHPFDNIKKMIASMISCDINFVVRMVDEKNQVAIGDRLQALSDISYRNFRRPAAKGGPRVSVGNICEARVISVGVKDMTLCCMGVDVRMKVADGECSWNHISNLSTKFYVGQWVRVRVLGVENYKVKKMDNEYDLSRLNLSIKQATDDPADKYWNMISVNQICLAFYSGRDDHGHYFAHLLNDDGPDILLAAPKFTTRKLTPGEKIRVRVNVKHEAENGKKRRYEGTFAF